MVDTGAATLNSVSILRPLDHAECGNSDLDEFGLLSLPLSFGAPTRVGSGRPADVKPRSRLASGWGIILPRRSSKGPNNSPPIWSISSTGIEIRVHGLVPSLRTSLERKPARAYL